MLSLKVSPSKILLVVLICFFCFVFFFVVVVVFFAFWLSSPDVNVSWPNPLPEMNITWTEELVTDLRLRMDKAKTIVPVCFQVWS